MKKWLFFKEKLCKVPTLFKATKVLLYAFLPQLKGREVSFEHITIQYRPDIDIAKRVKYLSDHRFGFPLR